MSASQTCSAGGASEPALDMAPRQYPELRLDICLASDGDLEAFYRLYSAYYSDAPAPQELPAELAEFDASAVARQAALLLDSLSADDQVIAIKMLTFICALRQPRANVSTVLAAGAMEHVGRRCAGGRAARAPAPPWAGPARCPLRCGSCRAAGTRQSASRPAGPPWCAVLQCCVLPARRPTDAPLPPRLLRRALAAKDLGLQAAANSLLSRVANELIASLR
jgi:hypothetical protein